MAIKKIICLAVDDEPLALSVLQKYIGSVPALDLVGSCANAVQALEMLQQHPVDLIFLDIQMPQIMGTDFIRTLKKSPKIIFTTAYNHYSIDAIRISAFDYLVKPIGIEDLQQAVERLHKTYNKQTKEKIDILKKSLSDNRSQEDKIAISTSEGIEFIPIKNILHIESKSNYSKIYMPENKNIMVTKILKDFEEMLLPYNFYRVHNSHLINLNYIKKYIRSEGGHVINADIMQYRGSQAHGNLGKDTGAEVGSGVDVIHGNVMDAVTLAGELCSTCVR